MPVSGDGILEATFDPVWAAVRLIVDGGMWPDPVDTITITRAVTGEVVIPVRGVQSRPVVGGTFVGSDHECPLDTDVTYTVAGYGAGVLVATATVSAPTTGAEWGLWLKVAGKPDLTIRVTWRDLGEVVSKTIGGLYTVAGGGGSLAQTSAQWSGLDSDEVTIMVATTGPVELARLRAVLTASRILLVQTGSPQEIDSGWYYVSSVGRTNPAGFPEFEERRFVLQLKRTGIPAGAGGGIAGTTWTALMDTYPTWADVWAAKATWFDVLKGF